MNIISLMRKMSKLKLSLANCQKFYNIFDVEYYLNIYPDVATSGVDPAWHYINFGYLEGRNPSPNFNTIWYMQIYPDAVKSGLNPLLYHIKHGILKGYLTSPDLKLDQTWTTDAEQNIELPLQIRQFMADYNAINSSGLFQTDYYLSQGDIGQIDPIEHFLRYPNDSREPTKLFDSAAYLLLHRDVRLSNFNPFLHYVKFGIKEKRRLQKLSDDCHNSLKCTFNELEYNELILRVEALGHDAPLISIVLPTFNSNIKFLNLCVQSVLKGAYKNWELIIVDDCSLNQEVKNYIKNIASQEQRIRPIFRTINGNISRATNDGVNIASGSFIAFLDHDDELTPDALLCVAESIILDEKIDVWYSDQIKCDEDGEVYEHFFKPDWSPIYLLGVMYIGHLLVVRSDLVRSVGGFDSKFDGVQDFDFILRVSERTHNIGHISRALYKWRAIPGSLAAGVLEKSGISEKQRLSVERHLSKIGRDWKVIEHPTLPHRLILGSQPASIQPKISIIIPSKDQGEIVSRCLDTLFGKTEYSNFEVILVDNGTTDTIALEAFKRHAITRIDYQGKFNFSEACNLGVKASSGEFILFLNNDTEIIQTKWLKELVSFFEDSSVGAVGPVLLYPDNTVQHAGIVLGARGTADHVMRFFPNNVDGYAGSLACTREVSGVTAACLMMRRSLFEKIGCFSVDYSKHYQDVDLCLKILQENKKILCVGEIRLIHHESLSRKSEGYDFGDRAILIDRWYETIEAGDKYYNLNLDLVALDYSVKKS